MKKSIALSLFAVFAAALLMSFSSNESTPHGKESATISWVGEKVTGKHEGTLQFKNYTWKFDASIS